MRPNRYRFQLLAPSETEGSKWKYHFADTDTYERYLFGLQRLRARAYLRDGAIQSRQVTSDGRFPMEGDERSWHLVLVDEALQVVGCLRLLPHDPFRLSFGELKLRRSALAEDAMWGPRLRNAIKADFRLARECNFAYVELAAWAIEETYRHTKAAFESVLASYAWAQLVGGCVSACTATIRNGSASMLRRIGGTSLESNGQALPRYLDPHYGCLMEILRFDSRMVPPQYSGIVGSIRRQLEESEVVVQHSSLDWPLRFTSGQNSYVANRSVESSVFIPC
jgi:hypothetical protein